jgi:hypothetical protein
MSINPNGSIIAIDPGTHESAVCIIHGPNQFEARKVPNEKLLNWFPMEKYPLAIEMIASYGMAVGAEVFQTCRWIGRFEQAHGGLVRLVYRGEVKIHLCGTMKAKDTNIRQALIDRFGGKGTRRAPGLLHSFKNDMYSALAVGLTALETPDLTKEKGN